MKTITKKLKKFKQRIQIKFKAKDKSMQYSKKKAQSMKKEIKITNKVQFKLVKFQKKNSQVK